MLKYHPRKGSVLYCDFSTGFRPPEMVKNRPVVVVSLPLPGRPGLCAVVPLSTRKPNPIQPFHHKMDANSLPPSLRTKTSWAKCDMLYTVGIQRFNWAREAKHDHAGRSNAIGTATAADLHAIEIAILHGLGFGAYL